MIELSIIQKITIAIIPIILAVTFHELAHGCVALWCGDPTGKLDGRLTLNPVKHIDPMGTIILPLITIAISPVLFGWAKPMPINERNFRNPKRDIILVSLAGCFANLVMAFAWGGFTALMNHLDTAHNGPLFALALMGQYGISINIFIMLFNLIPIPPLDGSRVVAVLLKGRAAYQYYRIAPYGFWILLALIFVGALNLIIGIPYTMLTSLIYSLFGL